MSNVVDISVDHISNRTFIFGYWSSYMTPDIKVTNQTQFFNRRFPWLLLILSAAVFIISGCGAHTRIHNTFSEIQDQEKSHKYDKFKNLSSQGDVFLALSFSGGGTRAAAFSYGVLSELRDTKINIDNETIRLLDEVDHISSVSGGSFTAAYYGLFGDQIFEDFETEFLRKNVQRTLINSLLNPINWFRLFSSGFDRTSLAIEYYDDTIFQEKTFGDMAATPGPFIQINATDLGTGQSFGFTEGSFGLLCSDFYDFKVARAVAASSAVPVAFSPVTLKNYPGCEDIMQGSLEQMKNDVERDIRMQSLIGDISTFYDKERRQFIHLVDGGISDNLGIRSMVYRLLLLNETYKRDELIEANSIEMPKNFVVILVNAETSKEKPMEQSPKSPSIRQVMNAVSSAQISRYNLETISQVKKFFKDAAEKFASEGREVNIYFIELKFEDIPDIKMRNVFNNMATSFSLSDEQVDLLYESGRRLLRNSKEFQRLLQNLNTAQ